MIALSETLAPSRDYSERLAKQQLSSPIKATPASKPTSVTDTGFIVVYIQLLLGSVYDRCSSTYLGHVDAGLAYKKPKVLTSDPSKRKIQQRDNETDDADSDQGQTIVHLH